MSLCETSLLGTDRQNLCWIDIDYLWAVDEDMKEKTDPQYAERLLESLGNLCLWFAVYKAVFMLDTFSLVKENTIN